MTSNKRKSKVLHIINVRWEGEETKSKGINCMNVKYVTMFILWKINADNNAPVQKVVQMTFNYGKC